MTNAETIRVATFNASLNRESEGQLVEDLSTPNNAQAKAVAEIIQRVNPDVLLVNEFDFDAAGGGAQLFKNKYLSVSQSGVAPVEYPYFYVAPSNTGIASGFDLNNDGEIVTTPGTRGYGDDALGFGLFPGQYGMLVYSKYPIDFKNIRTFQDFLWKDMPGALLPIAPETGESWYSEKELEVFRLSSKSHWDIPILVNGETVHLLASHPTPPSFDGEEDRNGRRNHDEIRFWADYITPGNNDYIYDDKGNFGGLEAGESFIVAGDQNADPFDGNSVEGAIQQLLDNPLVNTSITPDSEGAVEASDRQGGINDTHKGAPRFDTADFSDTAPGNLRVDYVLPSEDLEITDAGVFWIPSDDPLFPLVGDFDPNVLPTGFPSSDHRLVWTDVTVDAENSDVTRKTVGGLEFLGEITFSTGTTFEDTEVGGLSGITYDPFNGIYYVISDDRSTINPARFYSLNINLYDANFEAGDLTVTDVITLQDSNGDAFAAGGIDPEGIAFNSNGTLFISSEGNGNNLLNPFVNQFSLNGKQFEELEVPDKFLPTAEGNKGIRNNEAFESLTVTPDGRYLYTAVEDALLQDGSASTLENESAVRILQYDLKTGKPDKEFLYFTDAIPEDSNPPGGFADNGLTELLAIDNTGTFLALERSFAEGLGNNIRLYEVRLQGATDISGFESLTAPNGELYDVDAITQKRLLIDFGELGIRLDNSEGMTFGSKLPDGRQSLIVVSDNNFNDSQTTQFLAFGLDINNIPTVTPIVDTPPTIDNPSFEPLDILLVNDDGYQAEGIEVLYDALTKAGHYVTLVAPKDQQSGKGTSINVDRVFQPTEVVNYEANKWYVDGSPVVTTLAGLDYILEGDEPDLVISGINEGENVGASVAISSGTVSAATTATREDIPAIAVSAGGRTDEELDAAYEAGSEYVVDLIEQLQDAQPSGNELLPEGVGLNVNIPSTVTEGVALTKLDETGTIDFSFGELPEEFGEGAGVLIDFAEPITPNEVTNPESEGQRFLSGSITVTPVDGSWVASNEVRESLRDRLLAAPENPASTPLNILLTNDDGYDAEGIQVLYDVLTAAGHHVTLVAPKEQQSGTGTALDVDKILRPTEVVNVEDNQWYVDAGVRTTTWAGLDYILEGEKPDLVISGINEGENIGAGGAVSSGTVSAAVTALLRDVPAIAISAGIDLSDIGDSRTSQAYQIGADYLVNLIAQLQATQGAETTILPEQTGLSINIPVRFPEGVEGIQGVAFTEPDEIEPFVVDFGELPPEIGGGVGLRFTQAELSDDTAISPTSEGGQFLSGYITVTPIDGDWTAPAAGRKAVEELLSAPDTELSGDADDPAIWVNPENSEQSLVIGTLKDGGLATFALNGQILQTIQPTKYGENRYNNVDLVYSFQLGDKTVDLAIVSDRANDTLAIFKIDPTTRQLSNITPPDILGSIFGIDDGEQTAYGLATYTSPVSGKTYTFVSQREGNQIAQLELQDNGSGQITAEVVRTFTVPIPPDGELEDAQVEGMVVDRESGYLYVGQENFGIWKFSAEPDSGDTGTIVDTVANGRLEADVEGLTIYYGADGKGYLFTSSQGDNTFAVYDRQGSNSYLGNFAIDGVEESDGADIINVPLGEKFPKGMLVVQDGSNEPQVVLQDEEEIQNLNTNFKYVSLADLAETLPILNLDSESYDPRNPKPNILINSVASGDTTQTSTVLWARSTVVGNVTFEYSIDPNFSTIAGTKTLTVTDTNLPVKVQINSLTPGSDYYYRVTDAAGSTETGQFETAAALGTQAGFSLGVSGDWRGELAPYPAISNVAEKDLDLFVEHGDTIYADIASDAVKNPDGTRKEQAETIDEYRAKHSEVYDSRLGVNTWGDLRSSTSIVATIDDHEVTNDFSGGAEVSSDPRFGETTGLINDTELYENGLQAFQEYNPIRDDFYGETGEERTSGERKLYRYNTYGSDAATIVLDNRSFRDEPLEGANLSNPADVARFLTESQTLDRTMLGEAQLEDLKRDLLTAENNGITWKFVMVPEPIQNFGPGLAEDRFEGYAKERTEILRFIAENNISNVVFIAADIHGTVVNNLTYQESLGGEQIATNAFEISTGSVAFDPPFGPVVAGFAIAGNPELQALYNSLPVANDADSLVNDKDDFLKQILDQGLQPFGYDPIGLNNNLAIANGLIDATLTQGDYIATHTFGWTEFDVDPETQQLRVTTYGIPPYSEEELLTNPNEIINRTPTVVSEFVVNPTVETVQPERREVISGSRGNDVYDALKPTGKFDGNKDTLFTKGGSDHVDLRAAFGSNRVYLGKGDDLLYAGTNNTVFGSDGNDQFYVGFGSGDNLLTGGKGRDQFWLTDSDANLPAQANTITDFSIALGDVIGFANTSLTYSSFGAEWNLRQESRNTIIEVFGQDVAILQSVRSDALTESNFVFS